jgi:hypothetical protein
LSKKETSDRIEIYPGDSVVVIGQDGNLKKVIMPDINTSNPATKGEEKLLIILKLFDPTASIESFHNVNKGKLN